MIEVYKIFNGLDDQNVEDFFNLDNNNRTRGHNFKIKGNSCKFDMRVKTSSRSKWLISGMDCRLMWLILNSLTLSTFKIRLDKFMDRSN